MQQHMQQPDRKRYKRLWYAALLIAGFAGMPQWADAAGPPTPAQIKRKALGAQAMCLRHMDGNHCGNSGCGAVLLGCYTAGESVVKDAIQAIVDKNAGRLTEACLAGMENIANQATNDSPWLDDLMHEMPVPLDGDPIILYRLYFYEILYKTVNMKDCRQR